MITRNRVVGGRAAGVGEVVDFGDGAGGGAVGVGGGGQTAALYVLLGSAVYGQGLDPEAA